MTEPSRWPRRSFWLCLAVSAVVLNTCLQIEYWNARAGGILPRELPKEGNPKWRSALTGRLGREAQERWIRARGMDPDLQSQEEIGRQLARPLTEREEAEIEAWLSEGEIENRLHSWVAGFGLLQYLLAPIASAWAWTLRTRAQPKVIRSTVWVLRLTGPACVVAMLARGYFPSLGW